MPSFEHWAANLPRLASTCAIVWVACGGGATCAFAAGREHVVAQLRHQEQLVRSMECTYESRRQATTAEMIPLIEELCRNRADGQTRDNYVTTPEQAESRSYGARWWRSGPKERRELLWMGEHTAGRGAGPPVLIEAFDGQLVRKLDSLEGRAIGVIATAETGHWIDTNRVQPFSFLYEFQNAPYSGLIADAPDFACDSVEKDGAPMRRISFRHPQFEECSFVLLFDAADRLAERQVILKYKGDADPPRINEIDRFTGYERFDDPSGEPIWFPREAAYSYYCGTAQNGQLAEYWCDRIKISEVRFNVEIPDERFTLSFPTDGRVIDEVHGLGQLARGVDPERPIAAGTGRWQLAVAIASALLLGLISLYAVRRRSRQGHR
ncbi:MAG TPA: hypothetical protein VND64_35540 [Pirellulales bacterium]|nr:hypothetical protein [Pirellulales bacterium]